MKAFLYFWLVVITIGIISFGLKLILFPVHVASNELQTAYDTIDKTINADNAIYNYEWFKQQKEDIDATKLKLDNAETSKQAFTDSAGERSAWTFEDKEESARLNAVVLGIQNHLQDMIAQYNARAKMANRNIFQNNILPDYLDALTFIRK